MRNERGALLLEALLVVYLGALILWGSILLQDRYERRNNVIQESRNRAVEQVRS